MSHDEKFADLRWTRIFTPIHIPKYLVEQVRDRDYSVEDFYKYQELNCTRNDEDGMKLNPFSHLYVLVNSENIVKGFLWFVVDPLTKDLVIQTYSVDKEYWLKGKAVSKLAKHIKDIRKKGKLNKIYWVNNYPKHSERHGFKRSKGVLMEYQEENHGTNSIGGNPIRAERRLASTRSETISERNSGECCTASG